MAVILVAGAELHAAMQAEKSALVEQTPLGFNSEQLCTLQRKQAGRGIIGAQIVKSMYGFSVRYDSGLQEWGLIRPARGSSDPSLEGAEAFCRQWVAADPAHRYAWKTELEDQPSLGATRVNSADYDGLIVIERFGYHGGTDPSWAVPAWEEQGAPDLAGPFDTVEQAQAALEAEGR